MAERAESSDAEVTEHGAGPRRLCLFLGAGASVKAGVPHARQMLDLFREAIAKGPAASVLAAVESFLRTWVERDPQNRTLDVESVLEAISFLIGPREVGTAFLPASLMEPMPSRVELTDLRSLFLQFIRRRCLVSVADTDPYVGFQGFLSDFSEVHAFTVNYDIVLEQLAARFGLEYVDGFRLRWDPRSFEQESQLLPKMYLYKLHGSAVWFRSPTLGHISMPVKSSQVVLTDDTVADPLMMYPAQKWEYERPFYELLGMLTRVLEDPVTHWLVVVGYSFRDEHLNRILRDAAGRNPNLMVVLIGPSAEKVYTTVLARKSFGWKLEPGTDPGNLPECPLTERVIRVPFAYERVLEDFARERYASIREAVARYVEVRAKSERESNQPWSYVAIRLAEDGVVDLLPDVELRLQASPPTDTWTVGYEATKAVVFYSLGRVREANQSWKRARDVLIGWFDRDLSPMWSPQSKMVDVGFRADSPSGNTQVTKTRHGMTNIISFISRAQGVLARYSKYVEPDDPRVVWFKSKAETLSRLESYTRTFQGQIPIEQYILTRQAEFAEETRNLRSYIEQRERAVRAPEGSTHFSESELDAAITELVRRIESRYLLTHVL